MQVIHVFHETDQEAMEAHLSNWFGFPDAGPRWDRLDPQVVCFCGGRLFPLQRNPLDGSNILVAAVWHLEHWNETYPVTDWPDDERE